MGALLEQADPADMTPCTVLSPVRPARSARRCARGCPNSAGRCAASTGADGDGIVARRHVGRRSGRGRGRRGRDRAPGRAADRGAVAGDPRRESRRHVPGVRGGPPPRRAARRLRLVQPRRRVHAGRRRELPADAPPRPDTLYGVSKVFGEALGRYYVDRYGLQVACLRIGTFADRPARPARAVDLAVAGRLRAAGRRLPARGRPRLLDRVGHLGEHPPQLVAGRRARARVLPGRRRRGVRRRAARSPQPYPSDAFVGGGFTSAGFGIDEVAGRW